MVTVSLTCHFLGCSQRQKWRIPNLIIFELGQISLRKVRTGKESLTQAYRLCTLCDYMNQAASIGPPLPSILISGIGGVVTAHSCYATGCLIPTITRRTGPCQPTHRQFHVKTFLNSNFHSHFINNLFFLLSALLTPTILLTGLLSQTWTFSCCFAVSAIISLVHSCMPG